MRKNNDIANLIAQVDGQRMREHVFYLAKDPLPYRKINYTLPGHSKSTLEEADDYLQGQLESYGYTVEKEACQAQAFRRDLNKPLAHQYSPSMPEDPWYTLYNLYAKKRGLTKPDEIVIVVSHKDSQSWIDSPGANDNAVGTAANLEAARLLYSQPTARSLWFLFCNEEHRPWTSITAAQAAWQRGDNIVAVFNLDGPGVKSREATDAGEMTNVTEYITDEGKQLADLMEEVNIAYGLGLKQSSSRMAQPGNDQGSFVRAGYPCAVGIIGSSPYRDPNYHTEGDIPELVDYKNLLIATQASLAGILETAGLVR